MDARFTTPAATIDVANSNAARITRIPGTVTAKGAHTSERPWRQATAIYPEGAGVVTRTQLEAVAALALATTRRTTTRGGGIDAGMSASDDGGEGDDYARMLEQGAPEGRRRLTMTRLVGHYLHRGLGQREIGALLRPWADRCYPPVPYAHLDDMIRSLAASEARKRPPGADDGDGSPGDDDEGRQGADGGPKEPPLTQRERVQRGALQRAYATIADITAQVKAWEHLHTSKTFPDKAGDVLIHMHKRLGVLIGQHLPDDMGDRKIYIDEADMAAEGIPRSAFNEGRDILFNMGLLTREKRKKKSVAAPAGEDNDSAATRATARGKDWCYLWGINGPAVNALWPQLPTITEIPLTPQQIKAAGSRQARLEDAITREKPTPQVVHALKREAAAERAEKDRAIYEYRVAAQERDNARDQAEAAAGERDRALHEAQRIIQENQRPPALRLICHECGTIGDPAAWRCDDCRERERKEAGDSMLGFNIESERGRQGGTVNNVLKPNIESAGQSAEDLRPCAGGCGMPTPHGWTCKACLARPLGALHVPMDYAPRQEVSHGS